MHDMKHYLAEQRAEEAHGMQMLATLILVLLAAILGVVAAEWATGDHDIRDRIVAECRR